MKELLEMGVEKGTAELRPTKYNIVDSDLSFVGELLIGVSYSLLVSSFSFFLTSSFLTKVYLPSH